MKMYIGCDPGKKGGIAILLDGGILAWKMPETELELLEIFRSIRDRKGEKFCLVEKVHAMPGQGVTSMFTFGMGYGALRMAVLACGIPFEGVTPQAWMKGLGCLTGGDKKVTRARAQTLFPELKVTDAIADALLIAEFAKRQNY